MRPTSGTGKLTTTTTGKTMSDVAAAAAGPNEDQQKVVQALQTEVRKVRADIKKLQPDHSLAKQSKLPAEIEQLKTLLGTCKSTYKALQQSAQAVTNGGEPPTPTNDASGSPEASEDSDMAKRTANSKKSKTSARNAVKGKTTKAKGAARGPNEKSATFLLGEYILKHKTGTLADLIKAGGPTVNKDNVRNRARAGAVDHAKKKITWKEDKYERVG